MLSYLASLCAEKVVIDGPCLEKEVLCNRRQVWISAKLALLYNDIDYAYYHANCLGATWSDYTR